VQVTGVTIQDKAGVYQIAEIGAGSFAAFNRRIAFNGPFQLAAGQGGSCHMGAPVQCLWDTGTPSPGESWGFKTGQFSLTRNGIGDFVVDGIVDSGTKRMYGRWGGVPNFVAQAPSGVPAQSGGTPGSAAATVYYFNGTSYVATAWTSVTIYNMSSSAVAANVFLLCEYFNGLPIVVSEDCGP
jgi:hypothetical protein